jgi:anaerobic magnesium-protoporphyrin IX monomethyl ester cyclase
MISPRPLRIVFISPFDLGTFGLRCVVARLKRDGHQVHVVYLGDRIIQEVADVSPAELDATIGLVKELRPDWVGVSATSLFSHPAAAAVTRQIKQRVGDIPILWGGPYPTLMPDICLARAPIDFICVGEGEETAAEFSAALVAGHPLSAVPGIRSRVAADFRPRPPPPDLDALPLPDLSPENKYFIDPQGGVQRTEPRLHNPNYATKCSRGCPFRCAYCSNDQIRRLCGPGPALRRRSVTHVMTELRQMVALNPGCESISFWDDNFPCETGWVAEFAAAYRAEIGRPIFFWAHPHTVRERNIEALSRAAPELSVYVGIESGSVKTRSDVFLRNETDERICEADRVLSLPNIRKTYDFILEHPWESSTELEETFRLLLKMRRPFQVNLHNLFIFPRTALAERAMREDRATEDEMVAAILDHPLEAAQKIRWINGIPAQQTHIRAYWLSLILALGNRHIPAAWLRFLGNGKWLVRRPELLTDLQVVDWQAGDADFGAFMANLWLEHLQRCRRFFEKPLTGFCRFSPRGAWAAYLLVQVVRRWFRSR